MSRKEGMFYLILATILVLGVYVFTRWMSAPGAG
jgi:hypothetical protein